MDASVSTRIRLAGGPLISGALEQGSIAMWYRDPRYGGVASQVSVRHGAAARDCLYSGRDADTATADEAGEMADAALARWLREQPRAQVSADRATLTAEGVEYALEYRPWVSIARGRAGIPRPVYLHEMADGWLYRFPRALRGQWPELHAGSSHFVTPAAIAAGKRRITAFMGGRGSRYFVADRNSEPMAEAARPHRREDIGDAGLAASRMVLYLRAGEWRRAFRAAQVAGKWSSATWSDRWAPSPTEIYPQSRSFREQVEKLRAATDPGEIRWLREQIVQSRAARNGAAAISRSPLP